MNVEIVRIARKSGCAKCVAWAAHGSGEQAGECRIAPPRTSANNRWPVTSPRDFCSEWLPLEEPTATTVTETETATVQFPGPFSDAARKARGETV